MSNRTEFTQRNRCDYARTDSAGHDHIIRRTTDGTFVLLYRGALIVEVPDYRTAVRLSRWCERLAATTPTNAEGVAA